ncbi:hypothetical protein V5799_009197 [Amblyomma americanum]|uniref:Uncharacterized protein n=1 Tax=Amblyomma americanum TaxID=6943 RepID=A0AAQ4FCV6_AMBAM
MCSAWTNVKSCFNKQRTGFCSRKRIVHQVMCPGVKPWSCNMAELRCGCVKGTARRADGKCVAPNECCDCDCPDDNKCREACRERGFQNGYCDRLLLKPCYCYTRVYPEFNLPFAEKPPKYRSKDLSAPSLKVLQSRIKIVLVLISEAAWVMSRCQCMQSTFEEALSDYAVRTVGCHMPLDVEAGALSTTNQTAKINFTVKHKKAATRIHLQSGEPLCALWGLESANWNDEQYCFVTMEQICMQPVFNAFAERDRCAEKSAHAMDTLKRR